MAGYYMETPEGRIGYGLPQAYDPAATYVLRDCVTWQGSSYLVLREVKGVTPTSDYVNYALLAARGEEGAGNANFFTGTAISGKGTDIKVVVSGSAAGDIYINTTTGDLYQATAPDTWAWKMNLLATTVTVNKVKEKDGDIVITGENVPVSAKDTTPVATALQTLDKRLGGLSFAINAQDGGLDITYTE